jgi:hypothetical protein
MNKNKMLYITYRNNRMPKVLENGNVNNVYGVFICDGKGSGTVGAGTNGCRAKVEVYRNDLFRTSSTDFGGFDRDYYMYECPCCGIFNSIDYKDDYKLPYRAELPMYRAKEKCHALLLEKCQNDVDKWNQMYDIIRQS